jgi:hypothetical protein
METIVEKVHKFIMGIVYTSQIPKKADLEK